jgi:hypothetical protein
MQRALLMSILIATLVIPILNARQRNLSQGVKRTVLQMCLFITVWTLSCIYVYWHI